MRRRSCTLAGRSLMWRLPTSLPRVARAAAAFPAELAEDTQRSPDLPAGAPVTSDMTVDCLLAHAWQAERPPSSDHLRRAPLPLQQPHGLGPFLLAVLALVAGAAATS